MTPNRPKSAKKSGSRKSSAGAMQTRRPQDPRSSFSLLSKHKIWTAAALAAVIVVAIGLGYQLLNGSTRNMASASAATFVGSETCAGAIRASRDISMIKTILVPASGSDTDAVVFETALAAARPCRAHLAFFHVRVNSGDALRYTPHAAFARGQGLRNALQELRHDAESRSEAPASCPRLLRTAQDCPRGCA